MLSNDRFVASFGSVPAGDRSQIVKVAVGAVRMGFGVVICEGDTNEPMCTLTAAAQKKEPDHECYHVITDDKQARTIVTRLTKNDAVVNIAIDLESSKMVLGRMLPRDSGLTPTVVWPDETEDYWFDNTEGLPVGGEELTTTGWALVPPSVVHGQPLRAVGQTNTLAVLVTQEEETNDVSVWDDQTGIEELKERVAVLEAKNEQFQRALIAALKEIQKLKGTSNG